MNTSRELEYFSEESRQDIENYLPSKEQAKAIFVDFSLVSLIKEIEQLSIDYRLVRTKDKIRLKVMEELGEYAVAALGDKPVTESPREELVDVIITSLSLYFLEGGTSQHLEEYGHKKLAKAIKKLNQT